MKRIFPPTIEWIYERSIPEPNSGCWIWVGAITSQGYGSMRVNQQTVYPHRVVYRLCNGYIPHGLHVCHSCDNKLCVNPAHLFAGTRKDNMQDCLRKGRFKVPGLKGEKNGAAKLIKTDILGIRADARSSRILARVYGVSKSNILCIKHNKTWKEV